MSIYSNRQRSRSTQENEMYKRSQHYFFLAKQRERFEKNRLQVSLKELNRQRNAVLQHSERQQRQVQEDLNHRNAVLTDQVLTAKRISADRPRVQTARPHREDYLREVRHRMTSSDDAGGDAAYSRVPSASAASTPASCRYLPSSQSSRPCTAYPCALPDSYNFFTERGYLLRLYKSYWESIPEHRRPNLEEQLDEDEEVDVADLLADTEYAMAANRRRGNDAVERCRVLRDADSEWRRRHDKKKPMDPEIVYGRPLPMRKILKPARPCSSLQ